MKAPMLDRAPNLHFRVRLPRAAFRAQARSFLRSANILGSFRKFGGYLSVPSFIGLLQGDYKGSFKGLYKGLDFPKIRGGGGYLILGSL